MSGLVTMSGKLVAKRYQKATNTFNIPTTAVLFPLVVNNVIPIAFILVEVLACVPLATFSRRKEWFKVKKRTFV